MFKLHHKYVCYISSVSTWLQPNFNNSLHTTPTKAPFKSSEPHFQGGNPYQSVSQIKTDKQWELHPSQVVIETKLGHGGFGDVFQGSLKAGVGYTHLKSVAVKLLKCEFCQWTLYSC